MNKFITYLQKQIKPVIIGCTFVALFTCNHAYAEAEPATTGTALSHISYICNKVQSSTSSTDSPNDNIYVLKNMNNTGLNETDIISELKNIYTNIENKDIFYVNIYRDNTIKIKHGRSDSVLDNINGANNNQLNQIFSTGSKKYSAIICDQDFKVLKKINKDDFKNKTVKLNSLQVMPNPASDNSGIIRFYNPKKEKINIDIVDKDGFKKIGILSETQDSGVHEISFDSKKLDNGVYFCILSSRSISKAIKFQVAK